jgi:hypothetical protein
MSSIDYLKFLLKKTDKERKEDMDLEEAYLTQAGVIPRQRTIDPKQYDKLTEGQKMQFFNPHKTYDSDDKYKAIDKLKALLAKEGETNSGEKSHIEDEERKEKESTTPANYYPNFRKYDIDDRDPEDKEIF